jgi:predicted ATPase
VRACHQAGGLEDFSPGMLIPSKERSNDHLFVITGGPGTGKTAVLSELQRNGFACVREAAREIIQIQAATGGDAVPWRNMERYSSLMLEQSVTDYLGNQDAKMITFFDRGIPDTVAHYRLALLSLPGQAYEYAQQYRYNNKVFLLPPWREIYETDAERKQTFEEAIASYEMAREVYNELGYTLIEVFRGPVEARTAFILNQIENTVGLAGIQRPLISDSHV